MQHYRTSPTHFLSRPTWPFVCRTEHLRTSCLPWLELRSLCRLRKEMEKSLVTCVRGCWTSPWIFQHLRKFTDVSVRCALIGVLEKAGRWVIQLLASLRRCVGVASQVYGIFPLSPSGPRGRCCGSGAAEQGTRRKRFSLFICGQDGARAAHVVSSQLRSRIFSCVEECFLLNCRPSVLDSFSATVGHFSTLLKQLTSDKAPPLSNRVIIPLQVSSERDPELEVSHHTHTQTPHYSTFMLRMHVAFPT